MTEINVSESCLEILNLMLTVDPKKRPSAADLLNHRWFKNNLDAIINLLALNHSVANQSAHKSLFVHIGVPNTLGALKTPKGMVPTTKQFNFNQSFAILPNSQVSGTPLSLP